MRPTKPNPNSEVLTRTFRTTLNAEDLQHKVTEAVATLPSLNSCFVAEAPRGMIRVCGLDLVGDLLLRTRTRGSSRRVDIFFRRVDRPVFSAIVESLGSDLKPTSPDAGSRPSKLAEHVQSDRDMDGLGKVIFTESAMDSALLCEFAETRKLIDFSVSLRMRGRQIKEGLLEESPEEAAPDPAHRDHVVLHRGRKVALSHRVTLLGRTSDLNLTAHCAWLPRERAFLVGWFSESLSE